MDHLAAYVGISSSISPTTARKYQKRGRRCIAAGVFDNQKQQKSAYKNRDNSGRMQVGQTFTIEPMLTEGSTRADLPSKCQLPPTNRYGLVGGSFNLFAFFGELFRLDLRFPAS